MASILELDDNNNDTLYGSFTPYDYAPYDGYEKEIPNPDRGVGDMMHNDPCIKFKTTKEEIDNRIQAAIEAEQIDNAENEIRSKSNKEDFNLDYNNKIFDQYRYASDDLQHTQMPEYISSEDKILLEKYMPIIYIENDDNYKFINPNYYLEFTEILFNDKLTGHKITTTDSIYLCYNMFYETKRDISKTYSELSGEHIKTYNGRLFKSIMIGIEIDNKNIIKSVFLSSDLEKNSYQWIKPIDTSCERSNIFITKDNHNLYLLNNPIERYKDFTSYYDETCKNPEKKNLDLEPLCKSSLNSSFNADLIKYSQITNMDTFLYSRNLIDGDKLKWKRKIPRFTFIPKWFYKIVPKCFTFLYKYEYIV